MLIVDCYPILRYIFPAYYSYVKNGFSIQKFFIKEIEKHMKNYDPENEPENFIDSYLKEMSLNNYKNFSLVFFKYK